MIEKPGQREWPDSRRGKLQGQGGPAIVGFDVTQATQMWREIHAIFTCKSSAVENAQVVFPGRQPRA